MALGKRVYCLYRVSTKGQVDKNDIPMQRKRCREFAAEKGWLIVKELSEKGVSGFKVSAKNRDAIQEIQHAAVKGEFDILLVFMFDRLGRRDDETPFVVEWFVNNGIEVWSTEEGQQRFETHVDKLMNYIRFWQASGESIKTSIRTKTRMAQLAQEGQYTGGTVPFGYHLVPNGKLNKRGAPLHDLEVDEQEAQIVELMFDKHVNEGYGTLRLSRYLLDNGLRNRKGNDFTNTGINRILKNRLYTGVVIKGDVELPQNTRLQIVSDDAFSEAQRIMKERTTERSDIPLNLKGRVLLVGKVFCGHCGNRLTLTTSGKTIRNSDGAVMRKKTPRYQCHYRVRHPHLCDGANGYNVAKLDTIVEEVLMRKFKEISDIPESELLKNQYAREIETAKYKLAAANDTLLKKERALEDLNAEVIKAIRGESEFSKEILGNLITQTKKEVEDARNDAAFAQNELEDCMENNSQMKQDYDRLISWAELYESSSMERKKMIIAQLINSVHVRSDYEVTIDFKITVEQFLSLSSDMRNSQTDNAAVEEEADEGFDNTIVLSM